MEFPYQRVKVLWLLFLVALCNGKVRAQSVTLAAVGDVLLDRGVAKQIARHGYDYPFARVRKVLSSADVTFANLECPLALHSSKIRKRVSFKAHPNAAGCLEKSGIDVVSVANNHALDCGQSGLLETLAALRRHKVLSCGAVRARSSTQTPMRLTRNGIRMAFVAWSEFAPDAKRRNDLPTIALASPSAIERDVIAARLNSDVVIASFHWGVEGQSRPTAQQKTWAHLAVRSGADVVLGHHPHVLQGIEIVPPSTLNRRALIAYSLGNFVFDAPRHRDKRTAQSLILRCAFNRNGLQRAEILPIEIRDSQPRLATEKAASAILTRLQKLSAEFQASLHNRRAIGNVFKVL